METKYDTHVKPKMDLIIKLAKEGMADKKIAKRLGIADSTFRKYMKEHPELGYTLRQAKERADSEIENALFKKATGFKMSVKKPYKIKNVEYKDGKKVFEKEEVILAEEEVYIHPDTSAQVFWLKNRKPVQWNEKQEANAEKEIEVKVELTDEK